MGSRLRLRRKVLGLSQEKLAQALGITFQQVQKYEKGANRISASRLQQIASVLEVPVAFFFENASAGLDGAAAEPAARSMWAAHGGMETLLQAFADIRDERLQRLALDILAQIAKLDRGGWA